jgi:hypothetical protein
MTTKAEEWKPGSFTKNFSWGDRARGLKELYESIRLGFAETMADTLRDEFRRRVLKSGRIDYIPINFFLFNNTIDGTDYIVADELVYQALTSEHSSRFDKLALFAFNFSFAGKWIGASSDQRRPALWAYHYVRDHVADQLKWNTASVNANDIEKFVAGDPRYNAKTARKLSTNLNYLYVNGRLSEFAERRVERWWVDALFLALDRLIEDRKLDGLETAESQYATLLAQSGFPAVSGRSSLEKNLATTHLIALYIACGGRDRFSDDHVRERTALTVSDLESSLANDPDPDPRPWGAVHRTNPRILKSIPRACAMLARNVADFEVIGADELANFDSEEFIRRQIVSALERLRNSNVSPTMSAEELMKLTRDH